jgi:hypothetical protein
MLWRSAVNSYPHLQRAVTNRYRALRGAKVALMETFEQDCNAETGAVGHMLYSHRE